MANSIGMDAKFLGNGADLPMFGVETMTNLHAGFWADHRGSYNRVEFGKRIDETATASTPAAQPRNGGRGFSDATPRRQRQRGQKRRRSYLLTVCADLASHSGMIARRKDRNGTLIRHAGLTAGGDAGTPAAGRDDQLVLRDSAGAGGWRGAAAGGAPGCGRRGCNSAVRGRSADRSRTPRGIRCQANPLPKNNFAMRSPCHARQAGLDNGDRSWQVRTSSLSGDLLKVASTGPGRSNGRGPIPLPAFER